ncbi:MAG: glycosyltransferase family 2 protein [Microgenomates group bacterium]
MKFTIITPSYNQAKFLQQTIDSVVSQAGDFEIEYFILDGGSTDGSVNIIRQYTSTPKIKIIWQSKPDGGQTAALNYGLSQATGDIIAYINSDDYYLPSTFSQVLKYFNSHPKALWLAGNCVVTDPKLKWTFWLKHIWPIQYFKNCLYVFNTINQPSVFLKKELVDQVGLFDQSLHYAFDYDYWLRCLQIQLPSRIFHNFSVFRIHPDSKGNTSYHHQFDEDWAVINRYQPSKLLHTTHSLAIILVTAIYKLLK